MKLAARTPISSVGVRHALPPASADSLSPDPPVAPVCLARDAAVVVTFHGVGSPQRRIAPSEERVWLSRESFLRILDVLANEPRIEITFDDGNSSDIECALPALLERGLRATFFPLAGRIDAPGSLGTNDVRELLAKGMDVGSHGMHHRPWRCMNRRVADEEIFAARDALESLTGRRLRVAACPFGSYDRRSLNLLRSANFETVYTSDGGASVRGDFLRARNTLCASLGPEQITRMLVEPRFSARALLRRTKCLVKRWR